VEDKIESIPKTMEKYFGCSGKMVKPTSSTVKAVVRKIRKGKIVTVGQLTEKLATEFGVQVACPASTNKALVELSKEEKPVCYWRVVKNKGELILKYPNGEKGHAKMLQKEGFEIDFSKKTAVVIDFKSKLCKFS